jgi:hypothetical protein
VSQMRYRKPSVKTLLGVTKWKKRAKKALGVNVVMKPFRLVGNYKRRMLRQAGYYNPEMKMMRAMQRGQVAGPLGPLQMGEKAGGQKKGDQDDASLLMMAALAQHEQKQGHGQKQGDDGGPGLAGAMLMAAAMGGTKEHQHKEHGEHAHAKQAPKEEHHRAPAHEHAAEEAPAHQSGRVAKKKPRHRGLRLFGLVLTVLVVVVAVVSIWYFWLA